MKRFFLVLSGIALFAAGLFFLVIVGGLVADEVWPAVQNGSLNIASNSRILNILWEGNELYILLALYTLLAGGLVYAAFRMVRSASRKHPVSD